MRHYLGIATWALAVAAVPGAALAQEKPPSLRDSFRLGSGGGVLCQVQANALDPSIRNMFDRAYSVVCRDAAQPIGRIYALRTGGDDPAARLAGQRSARAECGAAAAVNVPDLSGVTAADCTLRDAAIPYRAYSVTRGKTMYVAEGLTGYDSALQLGLRTIVQDRDVPGEIAVATVSGSDPVAFARAQAGSLDPEAALAEGYRRNNSGSYAEAAEFFDTLLQRSNEVSAPPARLGEYVINRALQKSNLGEFAEADALFDEASVIPTADPVQLRLRRNFLALHMLNQRRLDDAVAVLSRPIEAVGGMAEGGTPEISQDLANEINSGSPIARQLGANNATSLTAEERSAILDAQALQLRGSAARLAGNDAEAEAALSKALTDLVAIREGRVASITRLRAQTMGELSAVAETRKDYGRAESLLRDGVTLLSTEYPGSAALNAANARLAAYLGRRGQTDAALALYREVVNQMTASGGSTTGFENMLAPYFDLLIGQIASRPELVTDFFLASETLVRPGVADTQAVLARELSGGADEASRLFRQSVNLARDIERTRIEIARVASLANPTPADELRLPEVKAQLAQLEADQLATQAKLNEFPKYRAISTQALTLADLQATLKPDEAYLKTAIVGDTIYMIYATPTTATAYRSPLGAAALDRKVDALRNSISVVENGQYLTYPFDVTLARELYVELIQPVQDRLASGVAHLIFEPDGGLLRLPITLFIGDQAGVDAYNKRLASPGADEFDFTGLAWLGKTIDVSTAVSARGFRDVRNVAPSVAPRQYLGLGSNLPVSKFTQITTTRSVRSENAIDCNWPLAVWDRPISPRELNTASKIIGQSTSDVITGGAFTDTALIARDDLSQYRILHFATHGLVAAPRPECPARPALLTSFGTGDSDGLLSFQEIYDLRLDADLVILSACDTAGKATVAATREIGLTVGGGAALDGLVRAFVGAGGRAVIASHWPAPDEYDATERLISGLFDAPAGTSVVRALRLAQNKLMDETATSHPYYWADFSVIGDGAQPVLRGGAVPQGSTGN